MVSRVITWGLCLEMPVRVRPTKHRLEDTRIRDCVTKTYLGGGGGHEILYLGPSVICLPFSVSLMLQTQTLSCRRKLSPSYYLNRRNLSLSSLNSFSVPLSSLRQYRPSRCVAETTAAAPPASLTNSSPSSCNLQPGISSKFPRCGFWVWRAHAERSGAEFVDVAGGDGLSVNESLGDRGSVGSDRGREALMFSSRSTLPRPRIMVCRLSQRRRPTYPPCPSPSVASTYRQGSKPSDLASI